jgi:hypothetical protein
MFISSQPKIIQNVPQKKTFSCLKQPPCNVFSPHKEQINHSYDILGAGMLWKPKDLHKIRQNSLKFTPEECYDKVLNEEFFKNLFCKMKNVITRK